MRVDFTEEKTRIIQFMKLSLSVGQQSMRRRLEKKHLLEREFFAYLSQISQ